MVLAGFSNRVSKLLTTVSWLICLVVVISFMIFAVKQTGAASNHQLEELNGRPLPGAVHKHAKGKEGVQGWVEEASEKLTSPFSSLTSGSTNNWVEHGGNTLIALLIYGFGLGYVARIIRVRA